MKKYLLPLAAALIMSFGLSGQAMAGGGSSDQGCESSGGQAQSCGDDNDYSNGDDNGDDNGSGDDNGNLFGTAFQYGGGVEVLNEGWAAGDWTATGSVTEKLVYGGGDSYVNTNGDGFAESYVGSHGATAGFAESYSEGLGSSYSGTKEMGSIEGGGAAIVEMFGSD